MIRRHACTNTTYTSKPDKNEVGAKKNVYFEIFWGL